ncbi:hypothetical protein A9Q75_06030 [Colwellia psychrerythraea]|uniref:Uncharacterized protein n=1 Tax=Colwellia psychrerythraea TaxID=28229 RepID=A0A1Y5EMG8_COLPS|nr:hypothetical protein A9Q75_06030 [Colwellia psychrerythraea]
MFLVDYFSLCCVLISTHEKMYMCGKPPIRITANNSMGLMLATFLITGNSGLSSAFIPWF